MFNHLVRLTTKTIPIVAVALLVVACASAPVQQMSDARQAIRAAQDAGAGSKVPLLFGEAQAALTRAETLLSKRMFGAARRSAEEARAKAIEALNQSNGNK